MRIQRWLAAASKAHLGDASDIGRAALEVAADRWRHVMVSPVRDLPWTVRGRIGPVGRQLLGDTLSRWRVYELVCWIEQHDAALAHDVWELWLALDPDSERGLGPVSEMEIRDPEPPEPISGGCGEDSVVQLARLFEFVRQFEFD